MSDVVIRVENISKRYRIGLKEKKHDTLGGKIISTIKTPIKNFRKLRSLSKFAENELSEDIIWALKDINFEVKQGEVLGIIGKNGAGKSTLLKILAQITPPSSGRVELRGRVASLLEVGTGFNGELTGRENVYLNGTILGMTKKEIDRKFDEIIDFSGVEKFIDTPVKRYSSGMTVRLAFAVAAFLEPEILLIDEVLAVGDAEFQKKCLGKMDEVAKGGRTVLFVSHNMGSVRSLCNVGILLEKGMISSKGNIKDVINGYLDLQRKVTYSTVWDNISRPNNGEISITSVNIVDRNNNLLNEIYTDKRFSIQINYSIEKNGAIPGFTIIFYDVEDRCLFGSINNKDVNFFGKKHPKGNYRSTCNIPANLLNDGHFKINLLIYSSNFSNQILLEDVLQIEVLDGIELREGFFGKYEGYFRPKLHWENT